MNFRYTSANKIIFIITLIVLINSSCKKDEDDTDCPNCPKISKILPEEGYHQDWISIQGSNLQKTDEGPITVSFNGVVVDSDSIEVVSDTEVRARVPKACGTGVVKVFYDSELFSSENIIFKYLKRVTISLFAGSPTATVSQDNPVQFSNTRELVIDQSTNVLYTCEDNKIRKINPDGLTASTFEVPLGFTLNNLGINAGGELFTCWQHAIFKLPIALQSISPILVAGDVSSSGHVDGLSNSAKFYAPLGIISDQENNLYVCDPDGSSNAFIRKITPQGMVSTIAGQAAVGYLDGLADLALFQYPSKLAMDETKNIYISDIYYIRKLLNSGTVGTVVGNGVSGSVNSPFPVQVSIPDQLVYGDGYLYFIDAFKHSIRQIDISTGKTINFMGSSDDPGYVESQDPQQVRFNNPLGLAYDNNRNILFVLDSGNHCIRKIQFE